ncbi:hypothetical protein D3C74_287460 [compost metagenome]
MWLSEVIIDNWSVIGPIVWGLVTAITTLTLVTKGISIAMAIFNAVMNANPIVLIITLILALIVTIYKLWTTNDKFYAAVMRIINAILASFDLWPAYFWQLVEWIMAPFKWWASSIGKVFDSVINGIIKGINKVLELVNRVTGSSYKIESEFNMEDMVDKITKYAGTKKDDAYAKAAKNAQDREKKLQENLKNRAAEREKEQSEKDDKKSGSGTSLFSPTGGGLGNIDKVNKLG